MADFERPAHCCFFCERREECKDACEHLIVWYDCTECEPCERFKELEWDI